MAYRNTLQADALKLVAKKLQSSLAVKGEPPEDGLDAYGDEGDDLMLALARKIVGDDEDAGSVESVFAQAQQVAAEAEALLVDEGWHAPEPEPVAVATAVAAEPVPYDDAGEKQRSLFSWAEFMADTPDEPLPRRGRRRDALALRVGAGTRARRCAVGSSRIGIGRGEGHAQAAPSPLSPPLCATSLALRGRRRRWL